MDEPLRDSEILRRSLGDPEVFAVFYERHAQELIRFFARRTFDPEAAAELTAETFAEAFASRRSYRDEGVEAAAWLFGIGRHQLGRFFRRGRVESDARRRMGMPVRPLPDEDYERIEELIDLEPLRRTVGDAVGSLPEEQRTAIRLRVLEGLDYPEVARAMSCTEAAARQRVSRALRKMANLLKANTEELELATEVER